MKSITRIEEIIMLSILNLGENAYLVSILEYVSKTLDKKVSLTSVHLPLSRLEKLGYLESSFGEATAVRGGRRKKIYSISKAGYQALEEYRNVSNKLWDDYLRSESS